MQRGLKSSGCLAFSAYLGKRLCLNCNYLKESVNLAAVKFRRKSHIFEKFERKLGLNLSLYLT